MLIALRIFPKLSREYDLPHCVMEATIASILLVSTTPAYSPRFASSIACNVAVLAVERALPGFVTTLNSPLSSNAANIRLMALLRALYSRVMVALIFIDSLLIAY